MSEMNTFLLVAIGVFLLWLATTGRIRNIGPAFSVLMKQS